MAVYPDESAETYMWCMRNILKLYKEMQLQFCPDNNIAEAAPQTTCMQQRFFQILRELYAGPIHG